MLKTFSIMLLLDFFLHVHVCAIFPSILLRYDDDLWRSVHAQVSPLLLLQLVEELYFIPVCTLHHPPQLVQLSLRLKCILT